CSVMGNIPVGDAAFQARHKAIWSVDVIEIVASVDFRRTDIDVFRPGVDALKTESMTQPLGNTQLPRMIAGVSVPERGRDQREVWIDPLDCSDRWKLQMSIRKFFYKGRRNEIQIAITTRQVDTARSYIPGSDTQAVRDLPLDI